MPTRLSSANTASLAISGSVRSAVGLTLISLATALTPCMRLVAFSASSFSQFRAESFATRDFWDCVQTRGRMKSCGRNDLAELGKLIRIESYKVKITRPGKVLFPEDGITKRDLIDYYRRIARWMLPHLRARPLMLQRYPDGIDKPGFFQKASARYYPIGSKQPSLKKLAGSSNMLSAKTIQHWCTLRIRRA